MMKIYLYLLSFILSSYPGESAVQPFFPPQIVFSPDDGKTIYAIDEINQRAYKTLNYNSTRQDTSYALQHFPYAVPDTPQSKYYVQILTRSPASLGCMFAAYWQYGVNNFNTFPPHWWYNASVFEIKNYMDFKYGMIHSKESSTDEDYWYANITCQIYTGQVYPCEEIYFKKNTEIPLRSTQVVRRGWDLVQVVTNYQIISIGKLDEKYFDSIPQNWYLACRDANLGILYYPQLTNISLHQSTEIHYSLVAPPDRINGTAIVTIQWKATECMDCVTWQPSELTFNTNNFPIEQILTITRIKDGPRTVMIPIFNGGGFERVPAESNPIFIQ